MDGAAVFPEATAARIARCARTRRSTTSTGRRRAAADWHDADGARHRPSRAARGDGRRRPARRASASPRSRPGRRGGRARGRRAARASACCSTAPMAARRCSTPRRHSLLDRPPGRAAGLAAAASSRSRQDVGAQLAEWPVDHTVKCLCFYHPDDPAELKARAGARSCCACYDAARKVGRELLVEIIAGKHGAARRRHGRARARRALRCSASSRTGGSSSRRRRAAAWAGDRAQSSRRNDPLCRGVVLLGLDAPEDELSAAFARRGADADRSRASPSAARSSPMPPRPGWPARSTTRPRSTEMAAALRQAGRGVAAAAGSAALNERRIDRRRRELP